MLDYSDEEPEPVRRRNHSPSASGFHVKPTKYFDEKEHDFGLETQTAFRGVKDRSSRLIMPRTVLPASDAFIINECVRDKTLQPNSQLDSFDLSIKGNSLLFSELPLNKSTGGNEDHPDSFFKSMRTIVFLSQFFAVLPVSGYGGPNYKSLRFKWLHIKTCFWFLTFLGTLFCTICSVIDSFKDGFFQAAIVIFGKTLTPAILGLTKEFLKLI